MKKMLALMLVFAMVFALAIPAWANTSETVTTPGSEWSGWPTYPWLPPSEPGGSMDSTTPTEPGGSMDTTTPMDSAMESMDSMMESMDSMMMTEPMESESMVMDSMMASMDSMMASMGSSMEPTETMDSEMSSMDSQMGSMDSMMESMDQMMTDPMESGSMVMDAIMESMSSMMESMDSIMASMDSEMPEQPGGSMDTTTPMDSAMESMDSMMESMDSMMTEPMESESVVMESIMQSMDSMMASMDSSMESTETMDSEMSSMDSQMGSMDPMMESMDQMMTDPMESGSPVMGSIMESMSSMMESMDSIMASMDSEMAPGEHDGMGSEPPSGTPEVTREAGADRFGTAVAASQSKFATATAVVLANGFSFPDSLTAAGLAGVVGGPVLLTRTDQVPSVVLSEISRLGAKKIYLIGSELVISSTVASSLEQAGYTVERVAGADRYATAAAVAGKIDALTGGVTKAFVVNGQVPWDALAASPYAFSRKTPILFVTNAGVPAATAKAIANVGITSVTVVGGTPVVSASTYDSVARLTSGTDSRVAGPTRYDTAHALAHTAIAQGWATAAHPGIAAADKSFADALVGGPVAGASGSVLLFTRQGDLTDASRQLLTDHASHIEHVAVFGGPIVVSDTVISDIESIVK